MTWFQNIKDDFHKKCIESTTQKCSTFNMLIVEGVIFTFMYTPKPKKAVITISVPDQPNIRYTYDLEKMDPMSLINLKNLF